MPSLPAYDRTDSATRHTEEVADVTLTVALRCAPADLSNVDLGKSCGIVEDPSGPAESAVRSVIVRGRIRQVSPRLTANYRPDCLLRNPELHGQVALPHCSRAIPAPNIQDVLGRQLAASVVVSADRTDAGEASSLTTFCDAVEAVLASVTDVQMVWAYARWIVAGMKNPPTSDSRSRLQCPCEPVRSDRTAVDTEDAVAVSITTSRPHPTSWPPPDKTPESCFRATHAYNIKHLSPKSARCSRSTILS